MKSTSAEDEEDVASTKEVAVGQGAGDNNSSAAEFNEKLAPPFRTPDGEIITGESGEAPNNEMDPDAAAAAAGLDNMSLLEPWVFDLPGQEEVAALDAVEDMLM